MSMKVLQPDLEPCHLLREFLRICNLQHYWRVYKCKDHHNGKWWGTWGTWKEALRRRSGFHQCHKRKKNSVRVTMQPDSIWALQDLAIHHRKDDALVWRGGEVGDVRGLSFPWELLRTASIKGSRVWDRGSRENDDHWGGGGYVVVLISLIGVSVHGDLMELELKWSDIVLGWLVFKFVSMFGDAVVCERC